MKEEYGSVRDAICFTPPQAQTFGLSFRTSPSQQKPEHAELCKVFAKDSKYGWASPVNTESRLMRGAGGRAAAAVHRALQKHSETTFFLKKLSFGLVA